jgi:thiamine biosynthesis protein ThiI
MDKDEISAEAARIGTLPISIIPDQDCCTLFTPRHPATRARLEEVVAAEGPLEIDAMVAGAIAAADVVDLRFPVLELPVGGA